MEWNGRKMPVWYMEKSSSIPFGTMPCQPVLFHPMLIYCSTIPVTKKVRILGVATFVDLEKVDHFEIQTYYPIMLTVAKFFQNHFGFFETTT